MRMDSAQLCQARLAADAWPGWCPSVGSSLQSREAECDHTSMNYTVSFSAYLLMKVYSRRGRSGGGGSPSSDAQQQQSALATGARPPPPQQQQEQPTPPLAAAAARRVAASAVEDAEELLVESPSPSTGSPLTRSQAAAAQHQCTPAAAEEAAAEASPAAGDAATSPSKRPAPRASPGSPRAKTARRSLLQAFPGSPSRLGPGRVIQVGGTCGARAPGTPRLHGCTARMRPCNGRGRSKFGGRACSSPIRAARTASCSAAGMGCQLPRAGRGRAIVSPCKRAHTRRTRTPCHRPSSSSSSSSSNPHSCTLTHRQHPASTSSGRSRQSPPYFTHLAPHAPPLPSLQHCPCSSKTRCKGSSSSNPAACPSPQPGPASSCSSRVAPACPVHPHPPCSHPQGRACAALGPAHPPPLPRARTCPGPAPHKPAALLLRTHPQAPPRSLSPHRPCWVKQQQPGRGGSVQVPALLRQP